MLISLDNQSYLSIYIHKNFPGINHHASAYHTDNNYVGLLLDLGYQIKELRLIF